MCYVRHLRELVIGNAWSLAALRVWGLWTSLAVGFGSLSGCKPSERQAQLQVQQAQALHQKGQTQDAIERLESLLEKLPGNVEAQESLGFAYLDLGEHQLGAYYLEKAARSDKTKAPLFLYVGASYQQVEDWSAAVTAYKAYVAHYPDSLSAWETLSQLYLKMGCLPEFRDSIEKWMQLSHKTPPFEQQIALAQSYRLDERSEEARAWYERAYAQSKAAVAALGLMELAYSQSDWPYLKKLMEEADRLFEDNIDWQKAQYARARCHEKLREYDQALYQETLRRSLLGRSSSKRLAVADWSSQMTQEEQEPLTLLLSSETDLPDLPQRNPEHAGTNALLAQASQAEPGETAPIPPTHLGDADAAASLFANPDKASSSNSPGADEATAMASAQDMHEASADSEPSTLAQADALPDPNKASFNPKISQSTGSKSGDQHKLGQSEGNRVQAAMNLSQSEIDAGHRDATESHQSALNPNEPSIDPRRSLAQSEQIHQVEQNSKPEGESGLEADASLLSQSDATFPMPETHDQANEPSPLPTVEAEFPYQPLLQAQSKAAAQSKAIEAKEGSPQPEISSESKAAQATQAEGGVLASTRYEGYRKPLQSKQDRYLSLGATRLPSAHAGSSSVRLQDWLELAQSCQKKSAFKDAIECYWEAVSLDAENAEIWNNLGELYCRIEDFDRAEMMTLEATRLKPRSPAYRLNHLKVLQKKGSAQAFMHAVEDAKRDFPDNPEITLALARVHQTLGQDPALARRYYEEFCRLSPHHPLRKKVQQTLAILPKAPY